MSVKETVMQQAGKFLKSCIDNNGTFLFATAAAGWILASAAQTIGLIANKNIGKEEKKFLVPQEILDGTFNIVSYAALTYPMMVGAEAIVKKRIPGDKQAVQGAKTLAAIAGGVISSNIITPLLRNKMSMVVKKKMEDKNIAPVPLDVYDGKTYPNFQAKKPLMMSTYINFTKNLPQNGSLRI